VPHAYKSYKVYRVIVLNLLARALGISIYQEGLEEKLDRILANADYRITKSDIRHEIRSNHKMTEKVLRELESEGLIEIIREERTTLVRITKKGILHLRKWNRFYVDLYREQLEDHYRYVGLPDWLMEAHRGEGL
jgi:predicted transcriptional regulator